MTWVPLASSVRRRRREAEESAREAAAVIDLQFRARLLQHRELWGQFPTGMRPFYLAQRKRCPYCGQLLELDRAPGDRSTWDHVTPRSRGGRGHDGRNKVIAHEACNQAKGDRPPKPCEILFCQITNEIVFAIERHL